MDQEKEEELLSLQRIKRVKQSKMKLFASSAKNLNISYQKCPRLKKAAKKKTTKKKAMMATWEDLDEEQKNTES